MARDMHEDLLPRKNKSSSKKIDDFLDVNNTQKELNTTLMMEYFSKVSKRNLGISAEVFLKGIQIVMFILLVFAIVVAFFGILFSVLFSTLIWGFFKFSAVLLLISAVLAMWNKYNSVFSYFNISLRDKSPKNIQRIYEIYSMILNNHDLNPSCGRKEDVFSKNSRMNIFKELATALSKRYILFSPVESVIQDSIFKLANNFKRYSDRKSKEDAEKKMEDLLNAQMLKMEDSEDFRKEILLKALNNMK